MEDRRETGMIRCTCGKVEQGVQASMKKVANIWQEIATKCWAQTTDEWSNMVSYVLEVDNASGKLRINKTETMKYDFLGGGKPKIVNTMTDVGTLEKPNYGLLRTMTSKPGQYYTGGNKWAGWSGEVGEVKQFIDMWTLLFYKFGKQPVVTDDGKRQKITDRLQDLKGHELDQVLKMLRLGNSRQLLSIACELTAADVDLEVVAGVVRNNSFLSLRHPLERMNIGKVTLDDAGDYMHWMIKTRNGKTIAIVSKKGATPGSGDIVVRDLVIGYL